MKSRILIPLFAWVLILPVVQAKNTRLEEALTSQQFKAFGLDKLSESELTQLSDWIYGETEALPVAEVATVPAKPDPVESFGREQLPEYTREKPENTAAKLIRSRLAGESSGWTGYTRFTLENGQTWRQVDGDKFVIPKVDRPEITIRKGFLGTYFLSFEGYNSECKVKRVE